MIGTYGIYEAKINKWYMFLIIKHDALKYLRNFV